jgi:cytochrome P450
MCRLTGETPHPDSSIGVEFNPLSGQQLADPYPIYLRARSEEPVFFSSALQAWCITRYDDVVKVLADSERFHSPDDQSASLGFSYDWVRRGFNRAFAPAHMDDLAERIRGIAHRLIDQFVDHGSADFNRVFSSQFPLLVILNLLGASERDASKLQQWGDEWITSMSSNLTSEQQEKISARLLDFRQYIGRLIDAIDERPDSNKLNLLSYLVSACRQEKDPPSREGHINACAVMALTGHETTTILLNTCLCRILDDTHQARRILEAPSRIAAMIEETLRFDTPLQSLPRITSTPIEIAGVLIPEGARVEAFVASANHDEAAFACPEQFDLHRQDAKGHLSFGRGAHRCVGAHLARLETRVALEAIMGRLPELQLASGHKINYEIDRIYRGPKELRIQWKSGP